jgi:hypothetical protein
VAKKGSNTAANGTPKGWTLADGATFKGDKQPLYLRDVSFRRETGKDNKQVRVCVVQTMIQPFTLAIARKLGVAHELYTGEQPNRHIKSVVLDLGVGRLPFGIAFYAAPDMEEPSIEIDTANIGPTISVRTDKEGPIYSALLDLKFSYPDPGDLLLLVNSIGDQWWVSYSPLQDELADVSEPAQPAADDAPAVQG